MFLGSAPALTPSMYSLMSHLDLVDGVLYPAGGFTRVIGSIEQLARTGGAELRTDADVRRIVVTDGVATGVELADGELLEADLVVSAADLHHTETVLLTEPESRSYPEEYWAKSVAGPSALLVYLGVQGELPELEHHTLFFAKAWAENFEAIFGREPRIPDVPSFYTSASRAASTRRSRPRAPRTSSCSSPCPPTPAWARAASTAPATS